jgi:hypothetical protein
MPTLLIAALLAQAPPGALPQARPSGPPNSLPGQVAPADGPAGWREQFDELWHRRGEVAAVEGMHRIVEQQLAAEPRSFDANWRLSALFNWEADAPGLDGDRKAELGKKGWEAGDRAIEARPDDVHAQYNAGTGLGLYSEGVGILTALSQGLEGKFRDRIQRALRLDKNFNDGAPQVVWGRYFFKLPWPKRDVDESIRVLTGLVESHPTNLRGKVYLADSLADAGSIEDARKLIQQVLDAPAGGDPPEDSRMKGLAREWMRNH